eukprot:5681-Eustigmatos_ZCMA.PRE.1
MSAICGSTCGMTPCRRTWIGVAPAARAASMGASSACSIASAKNLPIIPTECRPRASTPGSAPKPTAATNMMPRISSGIERRAFRVPRAA